MFNLLTMAAVAALSTAGGDSDARHSVEIEHAGTTLTAVYEPETTISLQQVGSLARNRPGNARCLWTAEVNVARHLEQADGSAASGTRRVLAPSQQIEGSFAGRCHGREDRAEQMLADRGNELSAHVMAVAERDRSVLLAELEAARQEGAVDL